VLDLDNIDPELVLQYQRAAEKKFSGLTTDEWKYLRRRAKTDLFFLARGVLGYKKLSTNLHGHLCTWMRWTIEDQFREVLLPRGHYKTTVVTKADGIQIVLTDDVGDQPWPRNLGPNCRVLLAHEVVESAARFLKEIADHFLQNVTLMGLFPELVPNTKTQRVNKFELELPRQEFWSEPTFDTMGVGGRSQGRHYNYIKADDLIGDKARDSKTEMQNAKDWFDNIQSFFSSHAQDHLDLAGTRWSFDDLYAHIHRVYGDTLRKYIRAVEEVGDDGVRHSIFPEEFPLSSLVVLRKNRKIWTAQYINDPKEGATEFDPTWKKFYYWADRTTIIAFLGHTQLRVDVRKLDIIVLYDPALGKTASGVGGFIVTGTDEKNRVFVLDAQKKPWKPPEALDYLFKTVLRFHPRLVGIEEVNFSGLYQNWLPREMQLRNIRFNIVPLPSKQREKDARIRGLANYFSAGQIFFSEGQADLIEEFDRFGASDDIHLLDALAYGPKHWQPALSQEVWDSYKKAEEDLLNERDVETGYSHMYS